MNKKFLSAVLAAAMLAVTGCAENGVARPEATPQSADTEETAKPKPIETSQEPGYAEVLTEIGVNMKNIDTDLLSEFGMTFAELEEKYGKAVSAEVTKGEDYIDVLYFFESSSGGYGFVADETDISEIILPDGSPQIKGDVEFKYFNGKAEDLFLGLETEVSIEELEKIYDVVMRPYMQADGSTFGAFAEYEYDGKHYNIHVLLKKDGIIDIDSFLGVSDNPQGM
jgi:hypothetical protein